MWEAGSDLCGRLAVICMGGSREGADECAEDRVEIFSQRLISATWKLVLGYVWQ